MIIHKFGGTSVGDADRMAAVAAIIADSARQQPTGVVVSAMRGVTDCLIAGARAAAAGKVSATQVTGWMGEVHEAVVERLLSTSSEVDAIRATIVASLEHVGKLLDSIAVLGELTARGRDAVVCHGERLSAHLLAAVLKHRGTAAKPVCATQVVVTDDTFGSARPNMERTREHVRSRICPLFDEGIVPVVTGYIGATEQGVPTTLGRSGSDFSAAIIAACADATELRIWTDVSGILTADPNVVPGARVLRELSYDEAADLARFGAEVLHPRTIGPIIRNGIPLRIVNSFNPDDRGTLISERTSSDRVPWPAIVSANGLQLLRLRGQDGSWQPAAATAALDRLGRSGIEVLMFSRSFSELGVTLVVREQDADHAAHLLSSDAESPNTLSTTDVATVSVIGFANGQQAGIASRAFAAVGRHGVRVVAVAQDTVADSVTFCIPSCEVGEIVRFLHRELGLDG